MKSFTANLVHLQILTLIDMTEGFPEACLASFKDHPALQMLTFTRCILLDVEMNDLYVGSRHPRLGCLAFLRCHGFDNESLQALARPGLQLESNWTYEDN